MTPNAASASQSAAQSLPPLPDMGGKGGGNGADQSAPPSFLTSILAGIAPVKSAVDQIRAACQAVVKSGTVPGSEQICGQIVALSSQLLPMAAQNMMSPGMGQGQGMGQGAGQGAGGMGGPIPAPAGAPPMGL